MFKECDDDFDSAVRWISSYILVIKWGKWWRLEQYRMHAERKMSSNFQRVQKTHIDFFLGLIRNLDKNWYQTFRGIFRGPLSARHCKDKNRVRGPDSGTMNRMIVYRFTS